MKFLLVYRDNDGICNLQITEDCACYSPQDLKQSIDKYNQSKTNKLHGFSVELVDDQIAVEAVEFVQHLYKDTVKKFRSLAKSVENTFDIFVDWRKVRIIRLDDFLE